MPHRDNWRISLQALYWRRFVVHSCVYTRPTGVGCMLQCRHANKHLQGVIEGSGIVTADGTICAPNAPLLVSLCVRVQNGGDRSQMNGEVERLEVQKTGESV